LFVSSGNSGAAGFAVSNQSDSMKKSGFEVDYFLIKGKGAKGYLKNIKPLRKFIKEHGQKYDIIHAHYSYTALVATFAGIRPLVVSLMGTDILADAWYKRVIKFCSKFFWDITIVKSQDMYDQLGIKDSEVIPNGVETDRFVASDRVICAQKLDWDPKKINIIFPANPNRPEKNFLFAKQLVAELNDSEVELHYFDGVNPEEVPTYLNAASVLLLTSLHEGSPNVIKEAMSCGRPIVTSRVGDVEYVLGNTDGCYICDIEDKMTFSNSLKSAIIFAKEKVSTEGRSRILEIGFDSDSISNKLRSLYSSLKK
jgi:glycosyltransferase involved in cell wall biosynthesis